MPVNTLAIRHYFPMFSRYRVRQRSDAKYAGFIVSDEFFVRANGIKLISGRDFREDDSAKVLVNETFVRKMGLTPETAPGKRITDAPVEGLGNSRRDEGFQLWNPA